MGYWRKFKKINAVGGIVCRRWALSWDDGSS